MSDKLRSVWIHVAVDEETTQRECHLRADFGTITEFAEWWNAYSDVHRQEELTVDDK